MNETERAQHSLEILVDRYSLSTVVSMLAEIAREKAVHVEEAWQDKGLARDWSKAATGLDNLADRIDAKLSI